MGRKVTFDYSKADAFISAHEMESMKKITEAAKAELLGREGAGNDFLGWIDLPVDYDKEEFERIKKAAAKIQSDSEVLVSEDLILAQEQQSNFLDTAFIM